MLRRRISSADKGETLIELIIAITILAVAVVAIASGITLSILVSDYHRKQSTAGAYVRTYAEQIQAKVAASGYVPCASPSAYQSPAGYANPSGYTSSVVSVEYLTTSNTWASTCGTDQGAERLTLRVKANDSRASEQLAVVVRNCVATCS